MRRLAALVSTGLGSPAAAHVGHVDEVAGHDHWIAGAVVAAAVLLGLWAAWKGRGQPVAEEAAENEGEAPA